MATFNKFDIFVYNLGMGSQNLAATNGCQIYLTNAVPSNTADHVCSELTQITQANGYTNTSIQANWTEVANITKLQTALDSIVWTATAGNFGPFQYVVLFNNNATPDNYNNAKLIGWWDYGSSINCNNGESFTVDFPANNLILSIT